MSKLTVAILALAAALTLAGCKGLEARYHQPPLPVTDSWPIPPVATDGSTADIGWKEFFQDERLRKLIAMALDNNRDLRVAVLTVEKARATYQIQRAARLPQINANGAFTRERISPVQLGLPASGGRGMGRIQHDAHRGDREREHDCDEGSAHGWIPDIECRTY